MYPRCFSRTINIMGSVLSTGFECVFSVRTVWSDSGDENGCLSGKVHEGTPTGKIETIDNLQTYVAAPKDGSKAKTIIFLVDGNFIPNQFFQTAFSSSL